MIDRYVYRCRRDRTGNVIALECHTAEWSPRHLSNVLDDLDSRRFRYLVPWETGDAEIVALHSPGASGARTLAVVGPDGSPDGLLALPHG